MKFELSTDQKSSMVSEFIEFLKTENTLCSSFNKFLKSEYTHLCFIGLGKTWFASFGNEEFEFVAETGRGVPENYSKHIDGRNRFVAIDSTNFIVENINGFSVSKTQFTALPELIKSFDDIKDLPSLGDDNFSILCEAFNDYYSHKNCAAQEYFSDENNVPDHSIIKVSETFRDVESGEKYGTIQYHIYFHSELIGIGTAHGKWLSTFSFMTFNKKKWIEMLRWLDDQIPDPSDQWDNFIQVVDPNCENMLDYVRMEGITKKDYCHE